MSGPTAPAVIHIRLGFDQQQYLLAVIHRLGYQSIHRSALVTVTPSRDASSSMTRKPVLCFDFSYSRPGLPRPTIMCTLIPASYLSNRRLTDTSAEDTHDCFAEKRRYRKDFNLVNLFFFRKRNRIRNDQFRNNRILNAVYSRIRKDAWAQAKIHTGKTHFFQGLGSAAQGTLPYLRYHRRGYRVLPLISPMTFMTSATPGRGRRFSIIAIGALTRSARSRHGLPRQGPGKRRRYRPYHILLSFD